MVRTGVVRWLGAAVVALGLATQGCVSEGCPPGYAMVGGACSMGDAGTEDAGDRPQHVTTLGIDSDSLRDDDAGAEDVLDSVDAGEGSAADGGGSVADAGLDAVSEPDAGPCGGATETTCWPDADEDGYAAADAGTLVVCDGVCPQFWTGVEPVTGVEDCAPDDPMTRPAQTELCNGVNDDCDATVDEGASASCAYDYGIGACNAGICELASCEEGHDDCDADEATGCEQPLSIDGHCGACGVACHALASCAASGVSGACACGLPSFGDGLDCKGFGPLAAGLTATCGIHTDHSVSCWGTGVSSRPTASFRQIAVGTTHACAVDVDDDIDCWGDNANGQVKDLVGSFAQVAVGESHSCALRKGRSVLCWGISKTNPGAAGDYGQAFDPPDGVYHQIAAGQYHNCALKADGTVTCWGSDAYGQASPPGDAFLQITAGGHHTCGLRADGTATCWGAGTTDAGTPVHMGQSIVPSGVSFAYLSAGAFHTCGVTTGGSVVCWGAGDSAVVAYFENGQSVPVAGTYLRVYAGGIHTCALDDQLKAVCWGADDSGQSSPPPDTWPLIP